MKTVTVNFQELTNKINRGNWDAEYCHPDRWSSEDIDNCVNSLDSWYFTEDEIEWAYNRWKGEIEADETINVIQWLSHDLAVEILSRQPLRNFYYPESATFNCIVD